ncbi:NAD(P)H-dependent oxidoreductase [uncultured Vibrio sp.]|uniref:FMN-dependent NADH-azoreductase n=1 Tax=uncultured Vibrio sp. TaxID=114054 RepID=UPI0025EDE627|nr:NAD(P)H-dependent oxidoreductase [uncultured Vibrio sp.]
MKNILAIYTSAAGKHSTSTNLAKEWIEQQSGNLVERDISASPVTHYDENALGSFFSSEPEKLTTSQKQALENSDQLVDEVKNADCLVLAVPMYNFSIPSTLKAWFDQIARMGKTFTYTENGPEGLLVNKRAVVILTMGGFHKGSELDFITPYIKHFLLFIGITDVQFIYAEGTAMGDENKDSAISTAKQQLKELIA